MARASDGAAGMAPRSIASIAMEEFKTVLPPTIFFAIGFNLIVLTQRILLSDYLLKFAGFLVATTTALIVGKAVLVADLMPLLKRYDNARPIRKMFPSSSQTSSTATRRIWAARSRRSAAPSASRGE